MDANHYNKNFRLKTQKAIEAINFYENAHSELARFSLLFGPSPIQPPPQQAKTLQQTKWNKLQFLPNELKFFALSLTVPQNNNPHSLRLIFKDFSGIELKFSVSTKPEPISAGECELKVRGEKIMRLEIPAMAERGLFITFYSKDLTFLKFKFDITAEQTQDLSGRLLSASRGKQLEVSSISRKSLYLELKTQRSQQSLAIKQKSPRLDAKDSSRLPKFPKVESTRLVRLHSVEQEKLRLQLAQKKRANLDILNEKQKELRQVSKKCIGLLEEYEHFCKDHREATQQTHRSTVLLIFLTKFIFNAHACSQEGEERLCDAVKLRSQVKRVAARFMKITRGIRQIQPSQKARHLSTIGWLSGLQAKTLYKRSKKNAEAQLIDCFRRVTVGALINKALNRATHYRGKARSIQVYWRGRNRAQISCFQEYINHQINDLLKKHPHFKTLLPVFYSAEVGHELSWQYLKDSSLKMKSVFGSYKARLVEIEEMKKANQIIRSYNEGALRKNQRQELVIPKLPPYPVFRYFRDISLLKAMVRSWLQIEHRKQAKNIQKDKKQKSPQRQKNSVKTSVEKKQ